MEKILCQVCGSEEMTAENGIFRCKYCKTAHITKTDVQQSLLYTAERELDILHFENAEDMFRDFSEKYPAASAGYWGAVRAKFGIKYVTDVDGKRLPICHASKYEDISKDPDYKKAVRYAESEDLKDKYEDEAERIAETCAEWRETAKKYDYDVFISFKASDENGGETRDLREMQNLYTHLTEKRYKVFFSPVSAREFTGKKYDAYILNALDKAKVMILYGSKLEYFTATWVRTEWTRYLRMIARGEKREGSLLVAADGVEPQDLPRDLRLLQAIDGKSREFYSLIDGKVEEILNAEKKVPTEKYCLACGTANGLDVKYCKECGGNKFVDSYEAYKEKLLMRVEKQNKDEEREQRKQETQERREQKKAAWAAGKTARREKAKRILKKSVPFLCFGVLAAFFIAFLSVCFALKPHLSWIGWTGFLKGVWLNVGLKTIQWELILTGIAILAVLILGGVSARKGWSATYYYLLCVLLPTGLLFIVPAWCVLILTTVELIWWCALKGQWFFKSELSSIQSQKGVKILATFFFGVLLFFVIVYAVHPEWFLENYAKIKTLGESTGEHAERYKKYFKEVKTGVITAAVFWCIGVAVVWIAVLILNSGSDSLNAALHIFVIAIFSLCLFLLMGNGWFGDVYKDILNVALEKVNIDYVSMFSTALSMVATVTISMILMTIADRHDWD